MLIVRFFTCVDAACAAVRERWLNLPEGNHIEHSWRWRPGLPVAIVATSGAKPQLISVMSAQQTQQLYQALVDWVVDTAPGNWSKVTINMEVLADQHAASNSWIIRCFTGSDQGRADYPARASEKLAMRDIFLELNDLAADKGERWTVCDFMVTRDGRYTIEYGYGAPARLSGHLV